MKGVNEIGRKRKQTNYRQYYKDYYGIDFGSDMVVHHMDFNHDNNKIDNLLLLPRSLHQKYHLAVSELCGVGTGIIKVDVRFEFGGNIPGNYNIYALHSLCDAMSEMEVWFKKKIDMDFELEHKKKLALEYGLYE